MNIRQKTMVAALVVAMVAVGLVARAETGAGNTNTGDTTNVGTLPPLNSDVRDCLEKNLGEDRMKIVLVDPTQATQAERDQIQACLTTPPSEDTGDHHTPLDPNVQACLIAAIGQDHFTAISTGHAEPTDAEEQAGHKCFKQNGDTAPTVTEGTHMKDSVKQCLDLALGHDHFEQIIAGKVAPTLADRTAAQTCFGAPVGPMNPDVQTSIGPKLRSCLIAAVGQDRFNAITTGASVPTATEQAAGKKCYQQFETGDSTDAVLPPPAQVVPFLTINSGAIKITGQTVKNDHGHKSIVLTGRAKPGTMVDLQIFSKGSTVAVQTDSHGVWHYTFNRALPKGTHRIFATTRVGKKTVRSAAKTVSLK